MNLNWLALISIFVKYGPGAVALIKQEEPVIQAFIKDIEAAFSGSGTSSSFDLTTVIQQFFAELQAGTPPAVAAATVVKSNPAMMPTSGAGGTFNS